MKLETEMDSMQEWRSEFVEALKELSTRVHKMERFMWVALGAIAILQFAVPFLLERLK